MTTHPHKHEGWSTGDPVFPDTRSACVCAVPVRTDLTPEDLPPVDRARAQRILHPREQARHLTARYALRKVLGQLCHQPPDSLALVESALGKPHLADQAIHFSISHSADWAVLAFAQTPLGIDGQHRKELPRMDLMQKRFFSEDEQKYVGDHHDRFFEVWTLKEAYLKATGEGIRRELGRFSVVTPSGQPALKDPESQENWNLMRVPNLGRCTVSLACHPDIQQPDLFYLEI